MKIAVEFDLQNRATIVHWPWGSHAFPFGDVGTRDMAEALELFAIESSRRFNAKMPQSIDHENLKALRHFVEHSGVQPRRFNENGTLSVPSLDDLLGDDFFGETQ